MNRILRHVWLFCLFALPGQAQSDAEAIRRTLAALPQRPAAEAIAVAWPYLDSPDATIRDAARVVIAAQPFAQWKERAIEEKSTWASLEILRALAEKCPRAEAAELSPHLCEQITTLRLEHMDDEQQLAALRLTRLVFTQLGPVSADERQQMLDLWSHFSAPRNARVRQELDGLLAFLESTRPR